MVIDVTERTFADDVLRRSAEVPVVVDFWASWCGPCRQLSPVLERLVEESNGAWILAKVDVDANQSLAGSFGVQGIPAVHAFKNGKEIARFVGALPEPQVRAWLEKLGPTPADLAIDEATAAEAREDFDGAARAYETALKHEPANARATAGLARVQLAQRTTGVDEADLRARVARDPEDLDALTALADLAFARGDIREGSELVIGAIRGAHDEQRERLRAHLVQLLAPAPQDDPQVVDARRALASALF